MMFYKVLKTLNGILGNVASVSRQKQVGLSCEKTSVNNIGIFLEVGDRIIARQHSTEKQPRPNMKTRDKKSCKNMVKK